MPEKQKPRTTRVEHKDRPLAVLPDIPDTDYEQPSILRKLLDAVSKSIKAKTKSNQDK